jgi:hypothetical protein
VSSVITVITHCLPLNAHSYKTGLGVAYRRPAGGCVQTGLREAVVELAARGVVRRRTRWPGVVLGLEVGQPRAVAAAVRGANDER